MGLSGQESSGEMFNDGNIILTPAFTLEPTIWSFLPDRQAGGSTKKLELTTDFSYLQKGGVNTSPVYNYSEFGELLGTGMESYRVRISYLSISPLIKYTFWKTLYIKAGPRMDLLLNASVNDKFNSDNRTKKDFNSTNYGITAAIGASFGKKNTKFIAEIVNQQDFTTTSTNVASGQNYRNFTTIINLGLIFNFSAIK